METLRKLVQCRFCSLLTSQVFENIAHPPGCPCRPVIFPASFVPRDVPPHTSLGGETQSAHDPGHFQELRCATCRLSGVRICKQLEAPCGCVGESVPLSRLLSKQREVRTQALENGGNCSPKRAAWKAPKTTQRKCNNSQGPSKLIGIFQSVY